MIAQNHACLHLPIPLSVPKVSRARRVTIATARRSVREISRNPRIRGSAQPDSKPDSKESSGHVKAVVSHSISHRPTFTIAVHTLYSHLACIPLTALDLTSALHIILYYGFTHTTRKHAARAHAARPPAATARDGTAHSCTPRRPRTRTRTLGSPSQPFHSPITALYHGPITARSPAAGACACAAWLCRAPTA